MSNHDNHAPAPVGGNLLTPVSFVLAVLALAAIAVLGIRFFFGLGAVTNLNDGYPWGLWVVADVVIGSAFACGGFSVAMLVYIFNHGHYHPLVRPEQPLEILRTIHSFDPCMAYGVHVLDMDGNRITEIRVQ